MENNLMPKEVAQKICGVMAKIKSVSKDGFNSFHKYKYVTDAAIVAEIRKEMIGMGLLAIPSQISCILVGELTTLLVEYALIDAETGFSYRTQVYGYGQDKGDKGIYKAATGAEKYFFLKTFLLPTDDDPEKDSKGDESEYVSTGVRPGAGVSKMPPDQKQERIGQGNIVKKTATGPMIFTKKSDVEKFIQTEFPKNEGESLLSDAEQAEVKRLIKAKNIDKAALIVYAEKEFGASASTEIKKKHYNRLMEWIIQNERDAQ